MAEFLIIAIIAIIAFVLWIVVSPLSLEEKLKESVIIKRNFTFKNAFEIWSSMSIEKLETLEGVVSCYNKDMEGSVNVHVDPRIGREAVIDQILNQIESSKKRGRS